MIFLTMFFLSFCIMHHCKNLMQWNKILDKFITCLFSTPRLIKGFKDHYDGVVEEYFKVLLIHLGPILLKNTNLMSISIPTLDVVLAVKKYYHHLVYSKLCTEIHWNCGVQVYEWQDVRRYWIIKCDLYFISKNRKCSRIKKKYNTLISTVNLKLTGICV